IGSRSTCRKGAAVPRWAGRHHPIVTIGAGRGQVKISARTIPAKCGRRACYSRECTATGGLMKDCPLCGETMRLSEREIEERVAGQVAKRRVREWICPECDYFEDAEEG